MLFGISQLIVSWNSGRRSTTASWPEKAQAFVVLGYRLRTGRPPVPSWGRMNVGFFIGRHGVCQSRTLL